MWSDALRVCKEYVPTMVASLQMEYDRYVPSENSPRNENVLLQEEHTDSKSILTKVCNFE